MVHRALSDKTYLSLGLLSPLNKASSHFQLLPMSKVDQSSLRIHEVPAAFTVTKKFYNKLIL